MPKERRKYHQMRLAQDGREYRCYKDINWGPRYNPETKAHHCHAMSATAAAKILKPRNGFNSMQVYSCGRWIWVTETPEHLGENTSSARGEPDKA